MIFNNVVQNPYNTGPLPASQSLKSESASSSANTVPTNNIRILEPNNIRRPLNNVHPNYLRHVNISNQSSSGSLTESYIRSRASLSPTYNYNEISTRYNMISVIPMKLVEMKKSFDKLA